MYKNQYYITNLKVTNAFDLKSMFYNNLNVYFHPSLNVSTAKKDATEILLLGYIINPMNPQETNDAIVRNLAETCSSKEALFKELQGLSGRYVILYKNESDFIAFNDVCALKQLYYGFVNKDLFLTSSPRMFLDFYGGDLQISEEIKEFIELDEYLENECTWFGDKCVDTRLSKVLSNHFLNIKNKKISRIPIYFDEFPNEKAVMEHAAIVLQGSINAITKRYQVLQMLTAGWESRLLLAASKKVRHEIKYLVFDLNNGDPHNADVWVPRNLSQKLGLNFQIATPEKLNKDFHAWFQREHVLPKTWPNRIGEFQYFYNNFSDQKVIRISGIAGGILKSRYGYAANDKVHSDMLYHFSGYAGKSAFVKKEIESWIVDARKFADAYNLPLLDLFYWEQKTTHWSPLWAFEQDIAIDEFCPLYNKNFLVSILKINPKKRVNPKPEFFYNLIKYLWEDTLCEPINPSSVVRSLRWIVKNRAVLDYHKIKVKNNINSLLKFAGINFKLE
jgi:hypothetical protein